MSSTMERVGLDDGDMQLDVVDGWTQLGNYIEAWNELRKVSLDTLKLPRGLFFWCQLHLAKKEYQDCKDVAELYSMVFPGLPWGWLFKATAIEKLGDLEAAVETLRNEFSNLYWHPAIPYEITRLYLALNDRRSAKHYWLWCEANARVIGDTRLKSRARKDPQMKGLFE